METDVSDFKCSANTEANSTRVQVKTLLIIDYLWCTPFQTPESKISYVLIGDAMALKYFGIKPAAVNGGGIYVKTSLTPDAFKTPYTVSTIWIL
jgi:hypothetical protein